MSDDFPDVTDPNEPDVPTGWQSDLQDNEF